MTAGIDAAALKPCPFCQGSPLVCDTDINGYAVACENGKCGSSSGVFPTKPMAVRAWNTRQSPSTPVEQREAVARIIDPDAEWDKRPSNSEMPAVMKDNAVFSMRRSAALRKATAILALPGSSRDEVLGDPFSEDHVAELEALAQTTAAIKGPSFIHRMNWPDYSILVHRSLVTWGPPPGDFSDDFASVELTSMGRAYLAARIVKSGVAK